jgi:hypothetical protein
VQPRKKNLPARYLSGGLALAAVLLLSCPPVHSLTCEECREMENKGKILADQVEAKSKEMKTAFSGRQYDKVTAIREQITDLRKQIFDLSRNRDACIDVCTPDGMKREECLKIKLEISKLEADAPRSPENDKKTDELYLRLLNCNKELKHLLNESR